MAGADFIIQLSQLARQLRELATLSLRRIASRLRMVSWTYLSNLLGRPQRRLPHAKTHCRCFNSELNRGDHGEDLCPDDEDRLHLYFEASAGFPGLPRVSAACIMRQGTGI